MSRQQKNRTKENNFWTKVLAIIVAFAFIKAGYEIFKVTYKKHQIRKEVEALKIQAKELEQGNQKLAGSIEYFKSLNFTQKEARDKLNVKKEGEKIVILRPKENEEYKKKMEEEAKNKEVTKPEIQVPNPIKWWDYFFKDTQQL